MHIFRYILYNIIHYYSSMTFVYNCTYNRMLTLFPRTKFGVYLNHVRYQLVTSKMIILTTLIHLFLSMPLSRPHHGELLNHKMFHYPVYTPAPSLTLVDDITDQSESTTTTIANDPSAPDHKIFH